MTIISSHCCTRKNYYLKFVLMAFFKLIELKLFFFRKHTDHSHSLKFFYFYEPIENNHRVCI